MKTPTRKHPLFFAMTLLTLLTVTSLACSLSGIGIHGTTPEVDITITQEELNSRSEHGPLNAEFHLSGPCRDLLDEVTKVELHDGFVRFIGTKHLGDGTTADGTLDLRLGAENDVLQMEIIAVDIPNFDLTDPCIAEFNEEAEQEMSRLVSDPEAQVLFKEVKVEEGILKMKIQVNIDVETK
ncbi:MAG: hypothetical protein C3F07_18430 [Anaerolineales bacterium]|nr:MAG: hypothetical protein C3F07_18430 [Anaerolineales bacterium]